MPAWQSNMTVVEVEQEMHAGAAVVLPNLVDSDLKAAVEKVHSA